MFVIEQPLLADPAADSNAQVLAEWNALYDASNEVACLMLDSMTPELDRQFENYSPYEMLQELKFMFEKQAGMKGYVDQLERLGYMLPQDLIVGLILNGLTKYFAGFVRNYNMHKMGKTIGELHSMLIEYEKGLPKKDEIPKVMMIKSGKIQKAKNPKPSAKEHPAKDDTYNHCKEVGHWKRNYHVYLAELLKKKKQVGSTSSSGFREARKLKQGALYLYVGNGVRAQVEAIGSYNLVLSNDIVICLDNCHYAPSITRGLVSVHRLVFETFKVFKNEVENQLGKIIKALQSDQGGEYISQEFKGFIKAYGIFQQLTPPYTPQHNGVSERRNHTLLDMVRSMMNLTTLSLSFWDYALESATRILNMVSTKKVDKTPYELWYGKVPNLSYLKEIMGYYFYFPPENKIVVARYVEFFEKSLITQEVSGRAIDLEEIQDEDTSPSEITSEIPMEVEGFEPPQEEVIPIRRSERTHRAPNRLCLNVEAEEHSLGDLNEPTSYKAAMLDPESNKWLDAMNAEMQSMIDNMVWVLVDLPPNCKTVGSKWIFKKKTDMDGIVHTYKARLVAKGYTQLYGVDYEETFSPVADIRAIRILISIAAFYDYEIWQMDVKTAFLNGYLDEDIYMVQPEGFVDPKHPRKVCKLQRSIYGLKQASRSWNKRFDEEIKRFGFTQNLDEPCVYQKASGSNVTFLILYVDDIIIMGNHIPSLQSVKDYLGKCFAMKDLGEAAFILGIKIYKDRSKRLIRLSQSAYMDKILKRYRMDNSKLCHIPMQERLDLNTSHFQQNPGEPHWTAVKTILKYLRNTKDMFLVYGENPEAELRVECYCDAGFETDRDDTKSQTGYVFILNGGAVDWKSSKQSTTAMSTTEAEYIAASETTMEAVWIRKFISGLGKLARFAAMLASRAGIVVKPSGGKGGGREENGSGVLWSYGSSQAVSLED
ncbi:retrotransposon protein, putative, ty1-copia subclass [Tanacetum coccineum]